MVEFDYDKFVVVAEKEWKLDYEQNFDPYGHDYESASRRTIKFPLTIGDIEWQMSSTDIGRAEKAIALSCTSVAERRIDQVHVEIHGYCRVGNAPNYCPPIKCLNSVCYEKTPLRFAFTEDDNLLHFISTAPTTATPTSSSSIRRNNSASSAGNEQLIKSILFIVRILKERALLPDFKSATMEIGHRLGSNVKLRVADQIFHSNKDILSAHSNVFDRMFNGEFKEANQAEVELQHEQPVDPALFEDFLLVLCVPDVLPNLKNLTGLFKLADYYEADNVREKCERHFRMCLEMPVEERFMLALELGNEQMKDTIMHTVDLAETKRIVAVLVLEKQREEARAAQQRKLYDEALAKIEQLTEEALANNDDNKKTTTD